MIINFNKRLFNKKFITSITEAYASALKILKIKCADLEVNIDFVDKTTIQELNKKFRNNDKVTDVLSFPNLLEVGKSDMQLIEYKLSKENFPMEINPETNCIILGDISICKAKVKEQAREYGNTIIREMTYMAVHGLLHLLGYDHMKDDDKKIMREVEEKILKSVNLGVNE